MTGEVDSIQSVGGCGEASEQTNVGCPCRIVSYTVPANLYADSSSNKPSAYRRLCVDMSVGRETLLVEREDLVLMKRKSPHP